MKLLRQNTTKTYRPRVHQLIDAINGADDEGRAALAAECQTSIGNLRQIAYGFGACSLSQAVLIVDAVEGVTLGDLCPAILGVRTKFSYK